MNHTPYISVTGRIVLVAVPVILITVIFIGIFYPSSTPPSATVPTVSPRTSATSPPSTPELQATGKVNALGIDTKDLFERVYLLEEALNLPAGPVRDQKIRELSTAAGFASTRQVAGGPASNAEKAARDVEFKSIRGCSTCIQIEPFDAKSLSVFSRIRIEAYRSGKLIDTFSRERISNWVNTSGKWKFAGLQY